MPARYKQVARAFRASFYPLALREDINRYNLEEETEDNRLEKDNANEEPEDTSSQESEISDDEDLERGEEFSDEGTEIDEEEWAREATAEEKRQFAKIPDAEYDYKAVVGSGYLPGKPKTKENFRLEVSYPNLLHKPEQINGWTAPVPTEFTQDISKLQDCANAVHFKNSIVDYRCRWCGTGYAGRNNQYRHERKCVIAGAPGHVCPNHPPDCEKAERPGHTCKCPENCPGAAIWTPDKENDKRKFNSRGDVARKAAKNVKKA